MVVGNDEAVSAVRKYANDIDRGIKRKPLLVSGPSGTGKSMIAHSVAAEHSWNVLELNASDYRDAAEIGKITSAATQPSGLFGKKNLILLDEVDELSARYDKDAGSAIKKLIQVSRCPIIMTATNRWSQKITFLRGVVDNAEFKRLSPDDIMKVLAMHSKKKSIRISNELIEAIAKRSNGDARSAINDMLALDGAPEGAIGAIFPRDRKTEIFATLDKIFTSNTMTAPLSAMINSDVQADMLVKWIDENLPKRYKDKQNLYDAYESLSDATIYASRASRSQYYTYWRYRNVMMASGIALSKTSYPNQQERYSFPGAIMHLSKTKEARSKGTTIAKKLRKGIHVGTARIKVLEMKLIAEQIKKLKGDASEQEVHDLLQSGFGLDDKELEWLVDNA